MHFAGASAAVTLEKFKKLLDLFKFQNAAEYANAAAYEA